MPTKSVKKTPAKKTVTKKTAAKKTVKATATKEKLVEMPAMEAIACKCGGNCNCGKDCKCGDDCKCSHHGCRFGHFMLKLIVVLIIFALGFAAAKFVDGNSDFRRPRVEFEDGCLDVASVKCPQMQAVLPMMDIDHDGCITHEEYRAIRKELGRQMNDQGMRN